MDKQCRLAQRHRSFGSGQESLVHRALSLRRAVRYRGKRGQDFGRPVGSSGGEIALEIAGQAELVHAYISTVCN